jgi:hypothetical protein
MSFREKSAWITLITLVVLTLFYITHLPPVWMLNPPGGWMLHTLAIGVGAFVVIEIVAHVIVAIRSPRDAQAPRDERERLIALKATRIAASVYAILSLGSVFVAIHLGANELGVFYCVFLSFILAEIVNYAARIVYYRRGA